MDLLDRLLAHDAWTTARLLEQSRGLSDMQLDQDFDLGHRTVRRTFVHLIGNMEDWTALMTAAPIPAPSSPATLDGLRVRLDSVSRELAQLARRIQAEGRWDDLWTDTLDDPPRQKTYGGGIAHLMTHSMHHRAQLIHMLKRLGVPDVTEGDVLSWEGQLA
ncbi:DinB family protein [Deinococcus koreensis]|uniref:Damage-inducible protein DinB n=1 Tax=Deinococcus koreensis TaxID=2054903 RepID=A0A2K3UZZ8_9DEIO|nr:DinB family protein [Deinococcus koreensis]PNY82118.1 damage-inducible protein DinB [Deinococcus koreensis]